MPDLGLRYQRLFRAGILLRHLAFEKAQIVIVARDWLEVLVPHDLGRDVGIVGIEQRERLSGDVAKQVAMVRREAHLARNIFRSHPGTAAATSTRLLATMFISMPLETAMNVPGLTSART